jgi:hypothetical protein
VLSPQPTLGQHEKIGEKMKTFLIVSKRNYEDHVGEEYDSVLEVDNEVISGHGEEGYGEKLTPISEWHNRVRGRIRKLWNEDATPEGATREEGDDQEVEVYLDAASPFNAMLIDLREVMSKEEEIVVVLAYLEEGEEFTTTEDPETLELLEKLDNR